MCIKLTQNGRILVPGSRAIVIASTGSIGYLIWGTYMNSHPVFNARMESLVKTWMPLNYELMVIKVDGFVEKDHEFKFSAPRDIGIIYKESHFLVITEPAGKQVSTVHHRQPCFESLTKLMAA